MDKENQKQSLSLKQRLSLWVGLLAFGILSWLLWSWPWQKQEEGYDVKRATERAERLRILREEEAKVLGSYAWQDAEARVVRIPIQEAMRLAVDRLDKKTVRKGGLIAAAISSGVTDVGSTNGVGGGTNALPSELISGVSNLATNDAPKRKEVKETGEMVEKSRKKSASRKNQSPSER